MRKIKSHLSSHIERPQIVGGDDLMKIERSFTGNESFFTLFMPLVEAEIDRLVEEVSNFYYNQDNANTSHSEEVA